MAAVSQAFNSEKKLLRLNTGLHCRFGQITPIP
jgi:hypothetical protein